MHSALHVAMANEMARSRTERRAGARGMRAGVRTRVSSRGRHAAARVVPARAAPGTDARLLGRHSAAHPLRGR